ncbi:hypothetical protein CLUG_04193 [Clavispora lusitaniae ATCC 42720]|uniref:Uncharacterized protein n=1 Tax=Clavispora lusitaniae (strain ATCC 42720) TaxID=306902 RepID=C4Y7L5_CLAL4|nr:uncharacterized protein CLUG_04193 [Clavispora lusitaniae ATCC 42720]EEQ40065.1 hypothetical protein CLUG_04193 [Clavispora lusitaniae ATCC 42720]
MGESFGADWRSRAIQNGHGRRKPSVQRRARKRTSSPIQSGRARAVLPRRVGARPVCAVHIPVRAGYAPVPCDARGARVSGGIRVHGAGGRGARRLARVQCSARRPPRPQPEEIHRRVYAVAWRGLRQYGDRAAPAHRGPYSDGVAFDAALLRLALP